MRRSHPPCAHLVSSPAMLPLRIPPAARFLYRQPHHHFDSPLERRAPRQQQVVRARLPLEPEAAQRRPYARASRPRRRRRRRHARARRRVAAFPPLRARHGRVGRRRVGRGAVPRRGAGPGSARAERDGRHHLGGGRFVRAARKAGTASLEVGCLVSTLSCIAVLSVRGPNGLNGEPSQVDFGRSTSASPAADAAQMR